MGSTRTVRNGCDGNKGFETPPTSPRDNLGPMPAELRIYHIAAGRMKEFVSLFHDEVAPARRANGFEVIGPWIHEGESQFVWIAGYDGELSWDEAVRRYYDSPERRGLTRDPLDLIESVETRMLGKK